MTPDFVDNQNGNTLASAIAGYLEWLTLQNHEPVSMSIATGYFNIEGFALLANHLERRPKVRLLLGAEPLPPPARPVRKPGDPKGPKFEAAAAEIRDRKNRTGNHSRPRSSGVQSSYRCGDQAPFGAAAIWQAGSASV